MLAGDEGESELPNAAPGGNVDGVPAPRDGYIALILSSMPSGQSLAKSDSRYFF
jgi:hypothetical protein